MRTRYLCRDYYFGGATSDHSLRSFSFLSLPAPTLPPPHSVSAGEFVFSGFDSFRFDSKCASTFDALPIDRALFRFLDDVVPGFCSGEGGHSPEIGPPAKRDWTSSSGSGHIVGFEEVETTLCESGELQRDDRSLFKTQNREIAKNSKSFTGRTRTQLYDIPQFEVVEAGFIQEECIVPSKTDGRYTLRIQGCGISQEMAKQVNTEPCLPEVGKSVYLVENVSTNYNDEEEGFYPVEDGGSPDVTAFGFTSLPQFEICEAKLDYCLSPEVFDHLISYVKGWSNRVEDTCANTKEFIGPIDYDILKYSVTSTSQEIPEVRPLCLYSVVDADILSFNHITFMVKDSAIFPAESSDHCFPTPCPVYLQEIQILDIPTTHCFQISNLADVAKEQEVPVQNFDKDMSPVGSLYELIISSELCLVDDAFKSLPAPILRDKTHTRLVLVFEDILGTMRRHQGSVCDGIYLDWHPLSIDSCNQEICATYRNMLMTVKTYDVDFLREKLAAFNFRIIDDSQDMLDIILYEEPFEGITDATLESNELLAKNAPCHIPQDENGRNEQHLPKGSSEKITSFFETMSQTNDLEFYMNARKGITTRSEDTKKEKYIEKGLPPLVSSNTTASSASVQVDSLHWNIEEHQVTLSDDIVKLAEKIQETYVSILTNDTDLRQQQHLFPVPNDLELLRFPKQKLIELIIDTPCENDMLLPLVALYVVKQMAYFLCYFGIHITHIYISTIVQMSEYMKERLSNIQCLIEDAYRRTEMKSIEAHPVLSVVEDILRKRPCQSGQQTLIVSEKLFWLSLKKKLTSIRINCRELEYPDGHTDPFDSTGHELGASIFGTLPHFECLIISHEFCNILEYGGSSNSSRICTISSSMAPSTKLHFIMAKMGCHGGLEALCEGSGSLQAEYKMDGRKKDVMDVINFLPTKETSYIVSSESANKADAVHDIESASSWPYSTPATIIVMNTQNTVKEMLVSRRSSYQKILATEKVGVQVLEREIDHPLDIIFGAATCLLWYDRRSVNITSATTGNFSYVARFMETLATNILMSLSFAYSSSILVFEGESTFLAAIMEFSDVLYAAAASLDMHLQLFCSYSPDTTDEIVLSCINGNVKLHKGLYPTMLESETLAESFLVKFPSISTLSAHVIISSSRILEDFFQWSARQRIQAIWKYYVPERSMILFNTLCRYGELGESKSGTTECSSIDSDVNSDNHVWYKNAKCEDNSVSTNLTIDGSLHLPLNSKIDDDTLDPSKVAYSCQAADVFNIVEAGQKASTHYHKDSNIDEIFDQKWKASISEVNNIDWSRGKHVYEDSNGEVIDWDFRFLDDELPSTIDRRNFPIMSSVRTEPMARNSRLGGRSGLHSLSMAFCPAEIRENKGPWARLEEHNDVLEENISMQNGIASKGGFLPLKRYGGFTREDYSPDDAMNMLRPPIKKKTVPIYGGNLSSRTNWPSKLQEGSNQIVGLLNRNKEKSKNCQKSLPCNICFSCPSSTRTKGKHLPSRSPSTIDSYRYQGASRTKKWQKHVKESVDIRSNEKKASSVETTTWTPIDKRARLNLSFARSGNEKQSKLVWISRNVPEADNNQRKRLFDHF